jgi:hypothetical protein
MVLKAVDGELMKILNVHPYGRWEFWFVYDARVEACKIYVR